MRLISEGAQRDRFMRQVAARWLATMGTVGLVVVAGLAVLHQTPLLAQELVLAPTLLADLEDTKRKFVDLAEALSWEHYAWRPMPGVRSVGEVFMHVAAGNVQFPLLLGHTPIDAIPEVLRRLPLWTDPVMPASRSQVVESLRRSFENARMAVRSAEHERFSATVQGSGEAVDVEAVLLRMSNHLHEHLGQQIAYARINQIVPPWSK